MASSTMTLNPYYMSINDLIISNIFFTDSIIFCYQNIQFELTMNKYACVNKIRKNKYFTVPGDLFNVLEIPSIAGLLTSSH